MQYITIDNLYITLGQLLKKMSLINSGGHAKLFLEEVQVKVNEKAEMKRGRKIYPEDVVEIEGYGKVKVVQC